MVVILCWPLLGLTKGQIIALRRLKLQEIQRLEQEVARRKVEVQSSSKQASKLEKEGEKTQKEKVKAEADIQKLVEANEVSFCPRC